VTHHDEDPYWLKNFVLKKNKNYTSDEGGDG
jgi:hypothetical protein